MTPKSKSMRLADCRLLLPLLLGAAIAAGCADSGRSAALPLIEPARLARLLKTPGARRPLLIQVGFRELFDIAHVPGSERIGPAEEPEALGRLKARVAPLPRDSFVVIYCGCCPWSRCPNVRPAAAALRGMGFKNAWILDLPRFFGTDWADKGYPTTRGRRA